MTTGKRIGGAVGIVLGLPIVLLVAALIAVSVTDLDRARPWINRTVSTALERPFEIRGDVALHWRRDEAISPSTSWRHWIPLPMIDVGDMHVGNPVWSARRDMASMGTARFGVEMLPLLSRTVVIRGLEVERPDVSIERLADGRNNWTFGRDDGSGPRWTVRIDDMKITDGLLALRDDALDLGLQVKVSTLAAGDARTISGESLPYGVAFSVDGHYRKATVKADGRAGSVLSLRDADADFPLTINARSGQVSAHAEGTLKNPRALAGLDMKVMLRAPSAAMLYPVTGLLMPNTPPFSTSGRLVGKFALDAAQWEYRDFHGSVGDSDIHGSLAYQSQQPRPRLTGQVSSQLLRLADLGPVIGSGDKPADPAASEAEAQHGQRAAPLGKVLPARRFLTNRWNAMDVDVMFAGKRIVRDQALPIDELKTHVVMQDGALTLRPLSFRIAGGTLDGSLSLDGSADPVHGKLRVDVKAVQLSQLFPTASEAVRASVGVLDGAAAIQASGNSMAELLGSSNGDAKVYMRDGTLSKSLLEMASLNIGSVVITRLFGDRPVNVRCAVADLALRDGVAHTRNVFLSTDEALIDVKGNIDFKNEQLALGIKPSSTKLKVFSLRSPLYVRGSFAKPDVGLAKGPLLARAGAATALAVAAAPLAVLVPITVPGAENDADCQELIANPAAR